MPKVNQRKQPQDNLPKLIGRSEASGPLGISPRTLDRAVIDGELKRIKIGTRVLFREEDLLTWIEAKTCTEGYR